jgi:hypothetical protein
MKNLEKIAENKRVLNSTYFPVEIVDAQEYFEEQGCDLFTNNVFSQIVLNGNQLLGVHGSAYTLISNRELIQPFITELNGMFGEDGYHVEVKNFDNRRFDYRFIVDNEDLKVMKHDNVKVMLKLTNSYDGSVRNKGEVSYYRQICSNGLHAWVADDNIVMKKHTSGNIIVTSDLGKAFEESKNKIEKFKKMHERVLTEDEIEMMNMQVEQFKAFPKKKIELVGSIIQKEQKLLGVDGPTAWLYYNAVNNIIEHEIPENYFLSDKERLDRSSLQMITKYLELDLVN